MQHFYVTQYITMTSEESGLNSESITIVVKRCQKLPPDGRLKGSVGNIMCTITNI